MSWTLNTVWKCDFSSTVQVTAWSSVEDGPTPTHVVPLPRESALTLLSGDRGHPPIKRQGDLAIVIWTQMQGSNLDEPISV